MTPTLDPVTPPSTAVNAPVASGGKLNGTPAALSTASHIINDDDDDDDTAPLSDDFAIDDYYQASAVVSPSGASADATPPLEAPEASVSGASPTPLTAEPKEITAEMMPKSSRMNKPAPQKPAKSTAAIQPASFKGPPTVPPTASKRTSTVMSQRKSDPSLGAVNDVGAVAIRPSARSTSQSATSPPDLSSLSASTTVPKRPAAPAFPAPLQMPSSATVNRRVSIQQINPLRPALSIEGQLDKVAESPQDADNQTAPASPPALSQDEYELLMRLEKQNQLLMAPPKPHAADIERQNSTVRSLLFKDPRPSAASLMVAVESTKLPSPTPGNDDDFDWDFWGKLLNDFETVSRRQNKLLVKRIQQGCPKALRGTLWHYLGRSNPFSFLKRADSHQQSSDGPPASPSPIPPMTPLDTFRAPSAFAAMSLEDAYVELLKLPSNYEKMISRDLARTFPKHEFFKNANGIGQESLFNVVKAYSLYDNEVGYCQGLSFVVGILLLNMPDEQAFSCLVHLMHTYQFRGLFTPRMELLQLRLFQFDRLVEELLPRVHDHLTDQGIRSTMYASQWFLTFFSYRFPLDLVFRLLDIIFACGTVYGVSGSEGGMMDAMMERVSESVAVATGAASGAKAADAGTEAAMVMLRFALALLKKNEEMVLALDFEPLLEFLKHGLFEVFLGSDVMTSSTSNGHSSTFSSQFSTEAVPLAATSGQDQPPVQAALDSTTTSGGQAPPPTPTKSKAVPRRAIDALVNLAMSTQFRTINKRKLAALRKDYDDEVKKTDPSYLNEKSLESQNQRLLSDLKRSENMLAELNRDHCDLAGQLVSLKIELAKERDVADALRRQVVDLKLVLASELPKLSRENLDAVLKHEVTADNATEAQPLSKMEHRAPSLPEQVEILQMQNLRLLEESHSWQVRAETFERQVRDLGGASPPKPAQLDGAHVDSPGSGGGTIMSDWRKRFMSPRLKADSTPASPTPALSLAGPADNK